MKQRDWGEINRQCLEIFALERAAREGISAVQTALPAAYERLNNALRPIVSEMVCMLIRDRREAERLTNAFLERLPLILPIHADNEFACEHWIGAVLIEFVYHTASLPRESLSEQEARLLQELSEFQSRSPLNAEERELIERVRHVLSPEEFLVWYDYVINGYAPAEIAVLHREHVSTVEETLQRARHKLWETTAVDATLRTRVDVFGQRLTWLGTPKSYPHSSVAQSVADDGTVVGVAFAEEYRYSDARGNYPVYIACAFRWQPYQFELLGELGENCQPRCIINGDGSAVFVSSTECSLRWTPEHGVQRDLKDGYIHAVNADGKVWVGELEGRAVQWRHDTLEVLAQDNPSAAYGVSADGKYRVGHIHYQAVRWDASGAIQRLGALEGGQSEARAVSRDGNVVVGKSDGRAFRWTPHEGMCALRQADEDISHAHSISTMAHASSAKPWTKTAVSSPSSGQSRMGSKTSTYFSRTYARWAKSWNAPTPSRPTDAISSARATALIPIGAKRSLSTWASLPDGLKRGTTMQRRFGLFVWIIVAGAMISWSQQGTSPPQNLQQLLERVEQTIAQRQYNDALQQIEALQGRMTLQEQAFLTHLRARALHRLRREDLRQECIDLWEQTRQTYRRLGNIPLEVEATLSLAFCSWRSDRARAEQLLEEVWRRLRAERDSSLELAQALSFCAEDWFEAKEWAICQRLWERALTMRQALMNADDVLIAQTRYNLGVVALRQNQLDTAQAYLQAALATLEPLIPHTSVLAATLQSLGELMYRRDNLEEAQRLYQRALQIHEQRGEQSLEHAQTLLGLGTIALRQQRWNDARNFYERARRISESVAPESREAGQAYLGLGTVALEQAYLRLGTVALETDQFQDAEQKLLKAAQNPNLEPIEQIQVSYELGRLALRRGDYKSAQQQFTQALERQRALPDTPLNIASTLYNLGVSSLEMGEVAQAREFCRQSLEIRQQENAQPAAVAHTLVALGFTEFYSRDLAQARRYFERALAAYDAANAEPLGRSRALMGLGFVATELGAFSEAETYLQNALQAQLKHNARKTALYAQTLIGLGNLALRRGELDTAFRYYTQAHALVQELPTLPLLKAQSLVALGNLALRQRDLQRADSYYTQAQQILDKQAPESPLAVQVRLNQGTLASELGDPDRAEAILLNARAAAERHSQTDLLARVNLSLAIAAIRAGRQEAARETLQQAITALQRPGGSPLLLAHALYYRGIVSMRTGASDAARHDFEAALRRYHQLAPNSLFVALAELNLAKLDYRSGNAPQARERLQRAIHLLEQQRGLIADPESQVAFSEDYYEAYSLLALLETERGQYGRAVELLEQSRARTFVEQIQRNRVEFADTSPALAELLRQQQRLEAQRLELRRQISQLYALVESPPDEALRKSPEDAEREARPLYDALTTIERELQQLEAELRTRFPEVARLLAPPQLTLAVIQQQLEPDVALIYHALVENNLLILVVTHQGVQAHYGAVNAERLTRAVERFREAIQQRNHSRVVELGAWLYETLIAPVATALEGYERVLLCSEGVLNLLPWAALIAEVRNNQPTYWVERVAIHTTPSVGVYRYARLMEPSPQGVLIAAVSQYVADSREQIDSQRGALGNLAYVSQEVANLKSLFSRATVLREEEVQPEVVRERARTARIVHFACHAKADSNAPLNSMLQFGVDANREVTAAQILANWRLRADLVTLSACETGTGKAFRYEGVFGLARAFLSVGAKSVAATLWQVNDQKTAELVSDFYKAYVEDRLPKDRALQKAQQAMVRNNEPPYYWAGFILVGDCR